MTERLKIVGEKFIDLGNFVAVALVFGQISLERKDVLIIAIGIVAALSLWVLGWFVLGKKGGKRRL